MGLYDIAKIMIGVVIFLVGVFMCALPKLCLKKSEREIEYAVKDVRKRGVLLIVVGVLVSIAMLVIPFITAT
ncbi:MAG: hypothetical protein J6A73_06535 [Lachnospiraceae bacterium]|nr:hypothetical protein [Lachnospiraceae bacterium]